MGVVIGIVGGLFLLAVLEARHQGITATARIAVGSPIPPQVAPVGTQPSQVMVGSTPVDAAENTGITAGLVALNAIPVVGQAISAVANAIIGPLLAAHRQRMQDATTENRRVAAATPSFYQTMTAIVNHYNAGRITKAEAISALHQLDSDTYTLLRHFVGSPGTAWNVSSPGICNKSCTVGCCIYNTWFHVNIVGGPGGAVKGVAQVLQAGPSSPIWNGGRVKVAGIPNNKYGFPGYPAFTLQLRAA